MKTGLKKTGCPKCMGHSSTALMLDLTGFVESVTDKGAGFIPAKLMECDRCKGKGYIMSEVQTVCMATSNGIN